MSEWLKQSGCTQVAMESTGVYWKTVYNILEGSFELLVVNAQYLKAVPVRKTVLPSLHVRFAYPHVERARDPSGHSGYLRRTMHAADDPIAVTNPCLLVEVTSNSTEDYDRGEKLKHYKSVETVREILIVSHREAQITVHYRDSDGSWAGRPLKQDAANRCNFRRYQPRPA